MKIMLCIPCHRSLPSMSFRSHLHLLNELQKKYELELATITGMYITEARSFLGSKAIEAHTAVGLDYVLWIDDDMVYDSGQVIQLIERHRKYHAEYDIVGAYYNLKSGGSITYSLVDKMFVREQVKQNQEVVDVDGTGFGCLLMKPEVLLQVRSKRGQFLFRTEVYKTPLGERFIGEDLLFFKDCKELGLKVGVDTNIVIKHYGALI